MAQNTKIEWTDHTINLWWGCSKIHEGCDNCYAETLANRWKNDVWGNDKSRRIIFSAFKELEKLQGIAEKANEVQRVFVGSMMDIFEKPMPLIDKKGIEIKDLYTGYLRKMLFDRITEGRFPNLMFLLLTKRPGNINRFIPESWKETPPNNVMFGTSPVNEQTAYKLVRELLEVNGKRFLSIEPQLGPISLVECGALMKKNSIHWVIQGGESGHHKRPFNIEWAYQMKKQCELAQIPYFFKQIDKVKPIPEDLQIQMLPDFQY